MRTKNVFVLVFIPILILLFQGCYTQIARTSDNEYYGEERESTSRSYSDYYDPYDYPPPSVYWGFRFYYPSWYSFWYYERWYPYSYVWYDPWYYPWYGPALVVFPAPYWWYRHYSYYHVHTWGWYGSSYSTRGYSRVYDVGRSPRTWGTTRGEEGGYRDFGGVRGSSEVSGSSMTVPPASSTGGTQTSGGSSLRRQGTDAREATRGVSTGRTATPSRRGEVTPPQRPSDRGVTSPEAQPNRTVSEQNVGREQPAPRRGSESSSPSSPRGNPERSVERSSPPSPPPSSQPSSPPPSRDYGGGRSSGNESRGSGRTR